jgi:hypothetical protein
LPDLLRNSARLCLEVNCFPLRQGLPLPEYNEFPKVVIAYGPFHSEEVKRVEVKRVQIATQEPNAPTARGVSRVLWKINVTAMTRMAHFTN